MKITVLGKGNVRGGLADLWEAAGHNMRRLGCNGVLYSAIERG